MGQVYKFVRIDSLIFRWDVRIRSRCKVRGEVIKAGKQLT